MSQEKSTVTRKKYELVAPDGGWGYLVCAGATVIFIAIVTFVPCFGLIYNDILQEMGVESTGVTLLSGLNAMSVATGGYLSSPLLKILSLRKLSFIGALIYNLGVVLLLFIKTTIPFFICQGVFQGIGLGLLYNLTFSLLNEYFVQRRLFAFSIIQTVTAAFVMCGPQLVKFSLNEFGYKGTLLVMTGVGLQAFVGVALYQPVKWHMRKVEIAQENELEVLLMKEKNEKEVPIVKLSDIESGEKESHIDNKIIDDKITKGDKSRFMKILNNCFDLACVKLVLISFSTWAVALSMFSDMTYTLLMPQAFNAAHWHEDKVAMALSLAGFGDLATRGVFILLSGILNKISNRELYIIGMMISSIGKLGMLISSNVMVVYVFVVLIGAGRCFLALLMPLVLADICPEKFTSVIGISLIFCGLVNLGLGPVVGAIRDFTNSYVITFYVLTAINTVCFIVWIFLVHRDKRQKNYDRNIVEKK